MTLPLHEAGVLDQAGLNLSDEQLHELLRKAMQPEPVQLQLFELPEPVAPAPRRQLKLLAPPEPTKRRN